MLVLFLSIVGDVLLSRKQDITMLLFTRFLIKAIWTVPTTALATVTSLEVILLSKAFVAFWRKVKITLFYRDMFFHI